MAQQRHNPLKGIQAHRGPKPRRAGLEELHAVQEIVLAKATPDEAAAFGGWLIAAAQAAADAAKDGGFLGLHADQVSERASMLDGVRSAVTVRT